MFCGFWSVLTGLVKLIKASEAGVWEEGLDFNFSMAPYIAPEESISGGPEQTLLDKLVVCCKILFNLW